MLTTTTTDGTGGLGSVGGSTGVSPDFVSASGFSVTPASQTTVTYTWSDYFTIALASGVAPSGGYVFGLGAVNSFGLGGGNFDPGASVTMAAGASSCQFRYMPLWDGVDTITVYPPAGLGGSSVPGPPASVSVTGVSIQNPGFTVTPASQNATVGSASGAITVGLTGGNVAPSGGLTFALQASVAGVTLSTGNALTIAAGSNSASFTVTDASAGTVRVQVTPPSAGVTGAAQSVMVTFATPVLTVPTAFASSRYAEVDIRCYNADGTRRRMPDCDTISWEIAERGGMQTGTLQMLVPWEQTGWIGNEYIDVRLWGNPQIVYRGWVRQPQQELGNPERSSPTLHGLFKISNSYMVRRDFGYTPPVSPSQLFEDLLSLYVTRSGRLAGLQIDTTGVDAMGLTLQGLQVKGQSIPQAMNALCDLFPNQLIWGGDVDAQGRNRVYLRPRATAVKYRFVVGRDVTAFVYPRDCTKVVNRIYVTGAKFDGKNGTNVSYVNLLPNASFETGVANNEIDGNVLVNPGFETNAFGTSDSPWFTGGAAIDTSTGHSGNSSCELNNDDISEEYVYQDFGVAGPPTGIHASCWWCAHQGVTWQPQIRLELFNTTTLVASSYMPPPNMPADANGYTYYHFQWDWVPPATVTCNKVRVTYILTNESATGFSGQTLVDDCSLWFDGAQLAKSWRITNGSGGAWSAVDWRNRDFTPYDGDVMVKATASITGGAGSYAEIATNTADRPKGQPSRAYFIQFMVYNSGGSTIHAAVSAKVIKAGVIQGSVVVGTVTAIAPGAWTPVSVAITTGSNCDAIEVGLRAFDSGVYYIDAAGMWADLASAPPTYVESDTFQAMRDVSTYSSGAIGFAAAASISTFGEREASVTNEDIIDQTTLDAYAISYFKAFAVPQVQATLKIENATPDIGVVGLDGQVKLVNLPSAPDALTPARIRYHCASSINLDIDLNNERPQLDKLLRLVVAGKA